MILGLSFAAFTAIHIAISLIAIAAGFVAIGAMLAGRWLAGWTAIFLVTTILTSVTGFLFPLSVFGPAHIVGGLSLIVLAVACYALDGGALQGGWRLTYIVTAVAALYFNCFVAVVQFFQKQPTLIELAPTQSELPFAAAQGLMLIGFIVLGVLATRRFHAGAGG